MKLKNLLAESPQRRDARTEREVERILGLEHEEDSELVDLIEKKYAKNLELIRERKAKPLFRGATYRGTRTRDGSGVYADVKARTDVRTSKMQNNL